MQSRVLTYDDLLNLDVWQSMPTITLNEMRGVKLMNRVDTKFVVSESEVVEILRRASAKGYRVQLVDNLRVARYDTLYYDTPLRDMYVVHHNRKLVRQKIRTRTYLDNDLSFFEVKMKSNRGRTRKKRVEIRRAEFSNFALSCDARELFATYGDYDIESLSPALATRFTRITLVNSNLTERLTIDMSLSYEDVRSGCSATIERMAIVELKQDGRTESDMREILQSMRIQPLKVSKYCLGTTLTVEGIRKNRFKLKLRDIAKRLGGLTIVDNID